MWSPRCICTKTCNTCTMAAYREHPEDIELNLQGVPAARRFRLDGEGFEKLLAESSTEIGALRAALGG